MMPPSKRIFDLGFAALGLIVVAPIYVVVALLVLIALGPPVIFVQQRPGYKSRPFMIRKFRTMTQEGDATGTLRSEAKRLTWLGRLLRSLSLDELPQLFNILRGEMSFVGPRPLLMEYLPLYSKEQARRHEAVPGLTGWAQVNGRNAVDWPSRLAMHVWYVDHRSFWLDMKILLLTLWMVVSRQGITQPGQATAEKFNGQS